MLEIAEESRLGVKAAELGVRGVEVDQLHGHGAEGVLRQLAEHSVQGLVQARFDLVLFHVLADVGRNEGMIDHLQNFQNLN